MVFEVFMVLEVYQGGFFGRGVSELDLEGWGRLMERSSYWFLGQGCGR